MTIRRQSAVIPLIHREVANATNGLLHKVHATQLALPSTRKH